MTDIIAFPKMLDSTSTEDSVENRVLAVDLVTQMHPEELKQAVQVVDDDIQIEWINRDAEVGITHRIGSNVFRRYRKGSRILASDDVGVVSSAWLEANFKALNELRKDWGGRITMVWNLVRVEGHTGPGHVEEVWNRIVAGDSPLDRIVVVQNLDMDTFPSPAPVTPEPLMVILPHELEGVLDQVETEHQNERETSTPG